MVLTHSGLYSETDIEKLHGDAIRIYSQFIPAERILVVDSLLQLIIHDFNNGKDLSEIRKDDSKKKLLAPYREKAEDEGRELYDIVKEYARFDKLFSAIDQFSMQAPNLQLGEILQSLRDGYAQQDKEYNAKVELLESKKRDPQGFENEINRIKSALEEYKLLLNHTTEEIEQGYNQAQQAGWSTKINELKVKYEEQITKCTDIETVRKSFTDGHNEIIAFIGQFSTSLTNELKAKLTKIGESFKEDKKITLPKIDLAAIEMNKNVSSRGKARE